MSEAVIVAGSRTAIGTAYKGSLTGVSAFELAHVVLTDVIARAGLPATEIDDLVLAENLYGGGVIGRNVAVAAGLPHIPAAAVNRHCASGLTAIGDAAAGVVAGMADVVVAGGTNSQSTAPRTSWRDPASGQVHEFWASPSHPEVLGAPAMDMSITVGWNTALEAGLTRLDQDEWALESHRKAVAAIADGRLAGEIVPLKIEREGAETVVFDTDEHPRATTSAEKLATLPPLHPEIDGFSVTAGNAAGLNDAAAAVTIVSADYAAAHGLPVLATVKAWGNVGVDPRRTGMAPIEVIPKVLGRIGRAVADVDLWEINEAFASVPVATTRILGVDPAIVNPVGSGCSLGHPIAASGARMVVSLVNELRRRGGGTGVATMCAGGGMGSAVVLDVEA